MSEPAGASAAPTGAPPPAANPALYGHAAAEAVLAGALAGGRLHHAWLLSGPSGVGKATLAYRFARRLLAMRDPAVAAAPGLFVDPSHPVFRRIAAGAHADLRTLARGIDSKTKRPRSEIVVDDVRAAAGFLRLTPGEGGWRVLIVDRVDEMNRNAANALLKLLEEPPARAVLLLVCDAPGRLLPTLRSRCRRLTLAPLDDAAMAAALRTLLPELAEDARAALPALAGGAPGRALLLAQEEGLRLAGLVDRTMATLPQAPPVEAYAVADSLGRGEQAFELYTDLLRARLAATARAALGQDGDGATRRLASLRPASGWAEAWQRVGQIQYETLRFNLDRTQALASVFDALRAGS